MVRILVAVATLAASLSPMVAYGVAAVESTQTVMILESHKAELASNPDGNGQDEAAQLAEEAALDGAEFAQR